MSSSGILYFVNENVQLLKESFEQSHADSQGGYRPFEDGMLLMIVRIACQCLAKQQQIRL